MPTRTAETTWTGGLEDGTGTVELVSSGIASYEVSFPKRAADEAGVAVAMNAADPTRAAASGRQRRVGLIEKPKQPARAFDLVPSPPAGRSLPRRGRSAPVGPGT